MAYTTPSMNLLGISIGVDSGLTIETNYNANVGVIDAHNHTSGNGVQIPPAGLNINSALSFQNNPATSLQAIVFTEQSSLTTLNAAYVKSDGNLYYNDAAGNVIQMTSGGLVNATSSGIASGTASASFSAGVLVVNSATNTPANIQAGSILIGNNVAASNFVTLSAPGSLGASYSLTLPTIPAAQNFLAIDSSGNIGAYAAVSGGLTTTNLNANANIVGTQLASASLNTRNYANNSVTRPILASVGQQSSASSGTYTFSGNTSEQNVTNLSITISTSGRPVIIMLQSDGSGSPALIGTDTSSSLGNITEFLIRRGGTLVYSSIISPQVLSVAVQIPPSIMALDPTPGAGTYNYVFSIKNNSASNAAFVENCVLVAYEL